jgi:hypothetical protein
MKNDASPDVMSILALGIFRIYLLYREFSRTEDESRNFGLLSSNSQLHVMVPNLTAFYDYFNLVQCHNYAVA